MIVYRAIFVDDSVVNAQVVIIGAALLTVTLVEEVAIPPSSSVKVAG